jgi:hypothetical protein
MPAIGSALIMCSLRATWSLRVQDGTPVPYDWIIGGRDLGRFAEPSPFHLPVGNCEIELDFGKQGRYIRPLKVEPGKGIQEFNFPVPE